MTKNYYEHLDETVYSETLPNGLKVVVVPKNDYDKTFAIMTTKYGGIDNRFIPYDKDELAFIKAVEDNVMLDNIFNYEYLVEYIFKKFYEFNSEIYDEQVLKTLRDNTCDSDKTLIKKINPFYEEIENIK